MVNKLTFETINSKIGKPGDPAALEEVTLANKQIDEVGSFAKFAKLKKLDLSNNRMRFKRNIEGLFQAPALEELDLRGNPVCNEAGYRAYMIEGIKTLKVLDGVPVGSERDQKPVQTTSAKQSSLFGDEDDEEDEYVFKRNPLTENTNKPTPQPSTSTSPPKKKDNSDELKKTFENNTPKQSSLFGDSDDDEDDLKNNNPLSKNTTQATTATPVKVEEQKEIPAKTSPVQEPPKAEKSPEPEKPKEVPKPKVEEQPVKKPEEKSTKAVPVAEKKPVQVEKPKEEPKPKPDQKTEEKPKEDKASFISVSQSTPGVFKDSRSGLEISTKLHEGVQAPEPQVVEVELPKKAMLTEDSLFGSKKSVFQEDVSIDRSLLEITEVPQKKPVVQKEQPKPAAKVTVTIADDDDDDLFGTKSKSSAKKTSSDEDLFSMVSNNKKDTVDLSKLNIDEYLANQSSANDSLFD